MAKNLPTYVLVSIIALLIWVVAENESVRVVPRQVDVEIGGEYDGRRVVRLDPAQEFANPVTVRLEGATVNIDAVSNLLRRPIRLTPELLGLPPKPGTYNADLRDALRRHPAFRDSGVTVTEVRPDAAAVEVDDLVSRTVRVGVTVPEGVQLQGVSEANPAEVTLRFPSRLAPMVPDDLVLSAVPEPALVSRLSPGRPQTLNGVRVEIPAALRAVPMGEFVRTEPQVVSVTLTLDSGTASYRIGNVPVALRIAPIDYAQWEVAVAPEDQSIGEVSVTGPRDLIARIRSREVQVFAVVPLTWAELEAAAAGDGTLVKDAILALSIDAVGSIRFDADQRSIKLTVRRRPDAPDAGRPSGVP